VIPDTHENAVWNYHMSRLQIGLYFLNLEDAIKHGDGYRLRRCFKFALLFEYKHRHTKYAYLLLHFFVKFYAVLSQDEALRLLRIDSSIMLEELATMFPLICIWNISI
jgi:hypothetical protein